MFKSLYAKLALTLILLLFVTAIVYSAISYSLTRQRIIGDLQSENADIAANLAAEIPQTVAGEIDGEFTEKLFYLMMIVNPDVELYLLDLEGVIVNTSVDGNKLARDRVTLKPLKQFLDGKRNFPLFAEDPRTVADPVTFSVAELRAGAKELGYLYVTLRGEDHEAYRGGRPTDLISRIGLYALIGSLLVSLLAGLYIFRRITARLQILSDVIEDFQLSGYRSSNRYQTIANDQSEDEISRLGNSYDAMAEQIVEQIELLEAQDQNRRSFIANISHDLRTPLTATQGYLELLKTKYPTLDDEQRQRYIGVSLKHSKRLQTLITDLFELAKLEDHSEKLRREVLSLKDLVSDVLQGYHPLANKKNIDLVYKTEDAPLLVEGDLALIDRAVSNILGNALQYTQAGGKVILDVSTSDNKSNGDAPQVILSVEDNGPGIDPTQIDNIFRRFHRADNQHSGSSNAGLGLAISQRIVMLHNGELKVENTPNGSKFSIYLPRANS